MTRHSGWEQAAACWSPCVFVYVYHSFTTIIYSQTTCTLSASALAACDETKYMLHCLLSALLPMTANAIIMGNDVLKFTFNDQ